MSESTASPDSGKQAAAAEAARAFDSYTAADHVRVAMAEAAWSTLEAAYRAIVPEAHRPDGVPPTAPIEAALSARAHAEDLLRAAVIASHERGLSWPQIGRGLGTSKQGRTRAVRRRRHGLPQAARGAPGRAGRGPGREAESARGVRTPGVHCLVCTSAGRVACRAGRGFRLLHQGREPWRGLAACG